MKHSFVSALLLSASFSGSVVANPHKIHYAFDSKQLTAKTQACLYGRGVQAELKQHAFKQFNQYVASHSDRLVTALDPDSKLSQKQAQYLSLAMLLKLTPESFNHTFNLVGNDTCTQAKATIQVDPEFRFDTLFDFDLPETLHFTSSPGTATSLVMTRLARHGLKGNPELIASHLKPHAQFKQQGEVQAYYSFEVSSYLAAIPKSKNQVFIQGETQFVRPLITYLQAKQFQIVTDPKVADWQIQLNANIEEQKFIAITLTLTGPDNKSVTLANNSRALPASDMSQPALLTKFSQVHFELMKLTERLRP